MYDHRDRVLAREPSLDLVAKLLDAVDPVRLRDHDRAEPHQPRDRRAEHQRPARAVTGGRLRLQRRCLGKLLDKILVRRAALPAPSAVAGAEADRYDASAD